MNDGGASLRRTGPYPAKSSTADALQTIAAQLSGLSYGSLLITVHEGKIVQLERVEKTRLY